ncbi:hypothetical protein B0I00_2590 [Novosphingobium kunmingense]|uniref:Uncharacterized protein n=1 Tax=Novosphingobium kunmingense TaxID=1211806 RepID=A0A2N0H4V1_9SPHN|nr:hypothetical protein [Novosphingobium kunmingense]PKB13962.1 hypothetical protein B0I00_2590 [Novosphingobium kunmingense]
MTMQFRDLASQAAADGAISAEELMALREAGWADGRMDPEEAESLFLANEQVRDADGDWVRFFVDSLSSFVVHTVEPRGYVDQAMADELIARIDRDGRIDSFAELDLLVRVIEIATSVPDSLKSYTLRQIEQAVLNGEGPTRTGTLDPRSINETECDLLRRAIFAAGGDRPAAVSRAEAEMLFRLKDATLHQANAPEWQTLFVQGVANYLLGFGGNEPLSAERAGELERFMAREAAGVGGFLGRMLTSAPDIKGFGSLLGSGDEGDHLGSFNDEAAVAEVLSVDEKAWLQSCLDADEELDGLEKALIVFLDAETGETFVPRPGRN